MAIGFLAEVRPFFESARPHAANPVGRWLLWVGTVGLLASLGTGYLGTPAARSVLSQTDPWREHAFLGVWTTVCFAFLSVWRGFFRERPSAVLAIVWMGGLWVLGTLILSGRRLGMLVSF